MKTLLRIVGAAALLAGLAAPVLAQDIDASKITCADMMAMDETGMMAASAAIKAMAGAPADMAAMSDEDVTAMAGEACTAHPEMMVADAMKSNM